MSIGKKFCMNINNFCGFSDMLTREKVFSTIIKMIYHCILVLRQNVILRHCHLSNHRVGILVSLNIEFDMINISLSTKVK